MRVVLRCDFGGGGDDGGGCAAAAAAVLWPESDALVRLSRHSKSTNIILMPFHSPPELVNVSVVLMGPFDYVMQCMVSAALSRTTAS